MFSRLMMAGVRRGRATVARPRYGAIQQRGTRVHRVRRHDLISKIHKREIEEVKAGALSRNEVV